MRTLERDGYEIHRAVFGLNELAQWRDEADWVAAKVGPGCVRHLRARSSLFSDLAADLRLLRLVPKGLAPVRSILFDKTAERNWPVQWHQDLTIAVDRKVDMQGYGPWSMKDGVVHVQPPVSVLGSMATVRIHLDDASSENGALHVCPGTHGLGKLGTGHARPAAGEGVVCECLAGDVLVMSPLILHSSRRSSAPRRRRVLHFEYAPPDILDPRLEWYEATSGAHPAAS